MSNNTAAIAAIQPCGCDEFVYNIFDVALYARVHTWNQVGWFMSNNPKSFAINSPVNQEFTFLNMYIVMDGVDAVTSGNPPASYPYTPAAQDFAYLYYGFYGPNFWEMTELMMIESDPVSQPDWPGTVRRHRDWWELDSGAYTSRFFKWKYVESISSLGVPLGPSATAGITFHAYIHHYIGGTLNHNYATKVPKIVYWWSRT